MIVRVNLPIDFALVHRDGGRSKLKEEDRCRLCERSRSARELTRHHLVPQHFFRGKSFVVSNGYRWSRPVDRYALRDAEANIVPLCVPCHRAVEDDVEARKMLRKALGSVEVTLAIAVRSRAWFERVYPVTSHVTWRPDDDHVPEVKPGWEALREHRLAPEWAAVG